MTSSIVQHSLPAASISQDTPRVRQAPLSLMLLFLLILLAANITYAASPDEPSAEYSLSQGYSEAKFYFNELLTNNSLTKKVENWERGAQNFRRIYLADPQSEHAPACLFMLGQMYAHMFQRFHNVSDLDESISYYRDATRLFPQHRLADDSYYAMGLLYLKGKQDPNQAAQQFSKIVLDYQAGDMHPQAAEMMKQLSTDHNLALPTAMVGNSGLSKLNYILPVKYWSSDDYTRIVIMASGPVNYREELLAGSADKPRRLYIDFQDSYIEPQYREPLKIEDGLLQTVRTAQFSKNTVRVVLDIETIDTYRIYSLPEPFRVVVDVRGKSVANNQKKLNKPAPVQTPESAVALSPVTDKPFVIHPEQRKVLLADLHRGKLIRKSNNSKVMAPMPSLLAPSLAQQLGLKVKKIVLDPGHGGKDPGALANGLKEKDIVLKFARQLQPVIEKEIGCEVLLTRDSDTFVSLEERTAIANTQNADLFISIHLNAHPSPQVRGIETYYLNLSTNAEAMRVAAMENATSTNQISDLQAILQDILQNSKITESSRLAEQVHGGLVSGLAGKSFGDVQNLGVKQAPFYVLIGAQMPAILMELAFISNEEDVRNLQSNEYLSAMAQEIAHGVQAYVNSATAKL